MNTKPQDFYSRSWYHARIADFWATTDKMVLGHLTANSRFDVDASQRDAWLSQIVILKDALAGLPGTLFLEFSIPRMGKRVDAVLVSGSIVLIVEFKIGADSFDGAAIDQVWDYALDLKNFHSASHRLVIVPILVATDAPSAVVSMKHDAARASLASIENRFPIVMARDLNVARKWVRAKARGSERFGILASSKAQRLKPHAVDIRVHIDPICWFLNGKEDTRSSYYLEDAATEFQVQGLELDWSCVTWDGDFRYAGGGWSFHDFRGSRWTNIAKPENRSFLRNAYRVLLTRARQGMVIFVPTGDDAEPTRAPRYYDTTYRYLTKVGIPTIT